MQNIAVANQPLTVTEVARLPGLADLPVRVRHHFGKALIAEAMGNVAAAEEELQKAVEAEGRISTDQK